MGARITPPVYRVQSSQAEGVTNISNAGSWADMTNMSITLTTRGGDVLLMFSGTFRTGGAQEVQLRFDVDGTAKHTILREGSFTEFNGKDWPESLQYLVTGLAAGSHTFKVQWARVGTNTVYQDGTSYPRVFTALEL